MNLFRETGNAFGWIARVMAHFLKVRPITTMAVLLLSAVSQVMSVAAMLLPLKVVILAGSEGVPSYLTFLMTPEEKPEWILILAILAVVAFLLTLLLEKLSKDLANAASMEVLEGANELAVAGRGREKAQTFYYQFSNTVAAYAFCAAIFVLVGYLDTFLIGVLFALFAAKYLGIAFYFSFVDTFNPGKFYRYISAQPGPFLNVLASIAFLVGFFVILYPILIGEPVNVLIALVSIIALRRAFGSLTTAIGGTVRLFRKRHIISPLVFKSRKMEARETDEARAFREIFDKTGREALVREAFEDSLNSSVEAEVFWQDPAFPQFNTFLIRAAIPGDEQESRLYQQKVFPERFHHFFETEDLLFRHLPRRTLMAPEVIAQFRKGRFLCQLCEYGTGQSFSGKQWKEVVPRIVKHLWELEPPRALVKAYDSSHPRMEKRLTEALIKRLQVAIDDAEESESLDRFLKQLAAIQERIAAVPLSVWNPEIKPANVVRRGPGDQILMSWHKWRIDPIGMEIPPAINRTELQPILDEVSAKRCSRKSGLAMADIDLVNQCALLEHNIQRGHYKAGLERIRAILPLIE